MFTYLLSLSDVVKLWVSDLLHQVSVLCDLTCKTRHEHMIFVYFFKLSELVTSYPMQHTVLWQWSLQHLVWMYLALWCMLQNADVLFYCWNMNFKVVGCSLSLYALFFQAWSLYLGHYSEITIIAYTCYAGWGLSLNFKCSYTVGSRYYIPVKSKNIIYGCM